MNTPFVVAQANTSSSGTGTRPVRTIKVNKPQGDQALTVQLGYDQSYKLDLSAIANEKITLVHIGEKLIILFDNKSTVTVEPFFDSMNTPLSNVTVEATGRDFTSNEFASAFPITTDQSVLTAAGVAGAPGTPASGADFHGPAVDSLDVPNPLPLLGQEELPNFVINQLLGGAPANTTTAPANNPPIIEGQLSGVVEEEALNREVILQPSDSGNGNEDENSASGDDHDTVSNHTITGQSVDVSLASLVTGGGALTFSIVNVTADGNAENDFVHDTNGNRVTSFSADVKYVFVNPTLIEGFADGRLVFTLQLIDAASGTFRFTLNDQIDHPTHTVDIGSTSHGALEETLGLDLSSLVGGHDSSNNPITLPNANMFTIGVIDDTPVAQIQMFGEGGLVVDETVPSGDESADPFSYGTPLGVSTQTLVSTGGSNPGADGLGSSTHLSLEVAGGSGADSGLTTTNGTAIHLFLNGAIVEGRVDGSGDVAFALSINDFGQVTVAQYLALHHPDPSNTNESVDLSGKVNAVVTVTDGDGDVATSSTDIGGSISFRDDAPAADADTNWTQQGGSNATGNVLENHTHNGAPVGTFADHADALGADGFGSISWTGASGGAVAGAHGTLTVDANGNYSYAINPADAAIAALGKSGSLTDTFNYTVKDGDGDAVSSTLTVTIFGSDHGVTITGIGAEGGDQTVNEANLLNGSSPNDPPLTQSGTFNISAPDGFGDLTIGGVTVVNNGVVSLPGSPITTAYGQLTITDVNLSTGVVSYSYKLTTDALVSGVATFDNVSVHLTDTDTSFADSTLTIKVVDDSPVAHADTDSAQSSGTATGNVVTGIDVAVSPDANGTDGVADTKGADGAVVSGVVAGNSVGTAVTNGAGVGSGITTALGTLTLNADGSYHYVAKANVSGTDTFTYTIKDGDGDVSETTLTIVVSNGAPLPVAATGSVDEAGLAAGSTPSSALTHTSGTLTLGDPDSPHVTNIAGVTSSAVGGSAVTVNGLYGTLQIDQNGNYTYTLTTNDPHHTTQGTNIDGQTDVFTYTVTDAFGNTGTNTITISIKDDVPTAGFTLGTTAVTIDETAGVQGLPANDHSGAWPLATPAGAGALMGWAQSAGSVIGTDTSKGGADGKASVSYALTTAAGGAFSGVDSGLNATATGNKIWLFTEGNLVVGREGSGAGGVTANAGGAVAFAIGLDGSNNLDVAQYEAIKHANASNPNDTASLTSGLLHVTQTVTDGDGDKATTTNATGLALTFTDDGPTAPTVTASTATVVVDETPGVQGSPATDIAGSTVVTFNGASSTVAALFATAPSKGVDTDVASAALDNGALSYATSGASIVTLTGGSFGADGPAASGATTYALFVNNQTSGLTVTDGTPITLALDGNGRVIGTVGNDVANPSLTGKSAFAVMLDPSNGQVYIAQYLSLHNPDSTNPNDPVTLTPSSVMVTATYKDGDGDTVTSALGDISTHITFLDDGPSAHAVTKSLVPAGHDTNIMLVLDVSGSMGDASGLTNLTRLDVLKAAVNELLEQYGDLGNVRVQIVEFSTGASQVGTDWMTIAQAKAAVDALTSGGNTNYDAGVTTAEGIFTHSGALTTTGVQNVSYFMSDGVPNLPSGSVGVSASEETTWTTFLNTNHIDSFALGIGSGVTQSALDPLAYNGQTHTNTGSVVVTDLSQLAATLVGTVAGTAGNILTDGGPLPGAFGADGGFVKSITADGTTYTYDPTGNAGNGSISASGGPNNGTFDTATNTETVTLNSGGVLTMVMDNGTYSYTAPANVSSGFTDVVPFVLIDNDGDTAGNSLTIVVSTQDHHPIVRDDHVITNAPNQGGADQIVIPDYALLFNDSDPESQTITITGVSGAVDGSVAHAGGNVTFTEESSGANDGGSFTYTGATTSPAASDTADVTVDRSQTGTTLTGTGLGEILMGRDGANNVINGNEGNDVLIAGNGNDTLDGGTGNDLMVGGAGNDTYIVDSAGDQVIENASGGTDVVQASVSYTLAANVENLTLTGSANINGTGNSLDNILTGNSGANSLDGGAGNDTITGAAGKDTMTGGSGNDTFVFNATSESGNTSGTADVITDFVHGQDIIDVSAIDANTSSGGNQAFTFNGVTPTAHGIWYTESGGNTIISMDTNGSTGSAEMMIVLTGIGKNLSAADFHL